MRKRCCSAGILPASCSAARATSAGWKPALQNALLVALLMLIAPLAWAQQPRVIITTSGGDITSTGSSLNVNCTGGCAAPTDNTAASQAISSGAGNGSTFPNGPAPSGLSLAGERGAAFLLAAAGTLVATLTPQCSPDGGTTYFNAYFQDPFTGALSTTTVIASAQATTEFQVMCPQGSSHVQLKATSFTSGTANFTGRSTAVTWPSIGWGVVTTSAPGYSTGQISPISLTTAGALRVDGSGVTQPVSGTITANQGGTWTVQPGNTPNTSPWLFTPIPSSASAAASTVFYNQAVTTAQTVKASAGNVYGWSLYSPNSSVCYAQFFNTTSPTLGTTVPLFSIGLTNGVPNVAPPGGVALNNFGTAIAIAATTGPQNATTCTTGIVADVWFQ